MAEIFNTRSDKRALVQIDRDTEVLITYSKNPKESPSDKLGINVMHRGAPISWTTLAMNDRLMFSHDSIMNNSLVEDLGQAQILLDERGTRLSADPRANKARSKLGRKFSILGKGNSKSPRDAERATNKGENERCGICWDDIDIQKEDSSSQLYCQHQYHSKCVFDWIQLRNVSSFKCPMCFHPLPSINMLLPAGWVAGRAKNSGKIYFYHKASNYHTWDWPRRKGVKGVVSDIWRNVDLRPIVGFEVFVALSMACDDDIPGVVTGFLVSYLLWHLLMEWDTTGLPIPRRFVDA